MTPSPLQTEFAQVAAAVGGDQRHIALSAVSRCGIMFCQSLFDAHPEILMWPGSLEFYSVLWPAIERRPTSWREILVRHLAELKLKAEGLNIYSRLGENGDQRIDFDYARLIRIMEEVLGEAPLVRRTLLLALLFAWAKCLDLDLSKVNRVFLHEHLVVAAGARIGAAFDDFPKLTWLVMVRDPRSTALSWRRLEEKSLSAFGELPNLLFFVGSVGWFWGAIAPLHKFRDSTLILRLEDMQADPSSYMRKLAGLLDLGYQDSLLQTTFGGLLWSGDSVSTRQAGFRRSADKSWQATSARALGVAIETVLRFEMSAFGYPAYFLRPPFAAWKTLLWLPTVPFTLLGVDTRSLAGNIRHCVRGRDYRGLMGQILGASLQLARILNFLVRRVARPGVSAADLVARVVDGQDPTTRVPDRA